MAVQLVLKRKPGAAHTASLTGSDTAEIPGSLVVSGSALAGTEVLRVQGETQIEGTLHGILNGTGLIIGVAGASASTGSAIQIGSFTTTQRGNLSSASGTAGMIIYNSTLTRFQQSNGVRWSDWASDNFQATTDPTTANDSTQGYAIGSLWSLTTTPRRLWVCLDATGGAAVWRLATVDVDTQRDTFGQYFLGRRLDYQASGAVTASRVQYTRVWLEADVALNTMQVFVDSGATGNINLGLYDQATPSSNAGTPRNLLASTGSTALAGGDNGTYKSIALSGGAFTITTAGYYWLASVTSATPHFAGTSTFRSAFFDGATNPALRFENSSGVTLPAGPAHTFLASAQSALIYVAVVE